MITAAEVVARLHALPSRTIEPLRALRRDISREVRTAAASEVVALAVSLLPHSRFVAYELIASHPAALASLGRRRLERLGKGMATWDAVDTFAVYLAGPAWRAGQIRDADVHAWARSRDRWWRRAALVSTVPLNLKSRGGTGDAARTLAVARLLVADRDDMVVKAMSWALRELAKREPERVAAFVEKHELAARVVREVRTKLRTGRKHG